MLPHSSARHGRTLALLPLWAPATLVLVSLFGGGLLLGLLQAMEPASGQQGMDFIHFHTVLTDPDFLPSLTLTVYIALVSTLVAAALSLPLTLLLHRQVRHNRLCRLLLQLPLTVPHLVVAIAALLLLAPTGLLARLFLACHLPGMNGFPLLVNDPQAIAIITVYVWKEVPFITLMLLSVLTNSGEELFEVGCSLGANGWQRFCHITLPLLLPSLTAAMLLVFAFTFGAFEVPYLLGQTYPMPLPVWAYRLYSDIDLVSRPAGIGLGLIIALLIIVLVILAQLVLPRQRTARP
jgi:putative spermidine/putrescine transport system permease protein